MRNVLSVCLLGLIPFMAQAQQAPAAGAASSVRLTFVIKPVLAISVDPEQIDFGDVSLDTGSTVRSPVPLSIRVRANTAWSLAASVEPALRVGRPRSESIAAAPAPTVRLENLVAGRRLAPLAVSRAQSASGTVLSGGTTGPDGLLLRPDLVVDIPPGTTGSYRLRIVLDLRGAP